MAEERPVDALLPIDASAVAGGHRRHPLGVWGRDQRGVARGDALADHRRLLELLQVAEEVQDRGEERRAPRLMGAAHDVGVEDVRPAVLPHWEPRRRGGEGDLWLVNPQYDPAAQTLTVFPRGRGLGDCGTIQTWTWTGPQGFALKEERFMGDCQGMSPDHWPTTWRTR